MDDTSAFGARLGSAFNPAAIERLRSLDPTGQANLVRRLFELFVVVIEQEMNKLEAAMSAGSFEQVRASAHSMRSSSLSVGADAHAQDCQALERRIAAGQSDPHELSVDARQLIEGARRLRHDVLHALGGDGR